MTPRILIAGIGNIFLGDDAFGVEVVRRLAVQPWPEGVRVVDFGIRGFDLAYALMEEYDLTILVDALSRGEAPGSLYVIEPDLNDLGGSDGAELDSHSLDPLKVLRLVKLLGGQPKAMRVVGCEPETFGPENEGQMGLSAPVQAALTDAVQMIQTLVAQFQIEYNTPVKEKSHER